MNLLHPEYYERARRSELLHEAEAERLANLARRTSVRQGPSPDPAVQVGLARLLGFVRRATA